MKRTILILLSLLMVFSLAACGSQTGTEETGTSNEQTEATTPAAKQTEPTTEVTEPAETEAAAEPETEASAFDTNRASNEFEQQIAEPEFESWEVKEFTEGSSWSIFVPEIYYEDVKAYTDDLRSYGFNINEDEKDSYGGLGYLFAAYNESGYFVEMHFEAHYADTLIGRLSLEIS